MASSLASSHKVRQAEEKAKALLSVRRLSLPEDESISYFGQHQDGELGSLCANPWCVCARFGISVQNMVICALLGLSVLGLVCLWYAWVVYCKLGIPVLGLGSYFYLPPVILGIALDPF